MGISGRQDRGGRSPRTGVDPRAGGRTRHRGKGSLSRAIHLCFAYLQRVSPFDAALCLPPLGRRAATTPSRGVEMGPAERHEGLSHARGRLAAYSHAARSFVKNLACDACGATAIEYALIASLISI